MYTYDILQTKKLPELRSIITNTGMGWARTETKVDLINRIVLNATTSQPNDRKQPIKEAVAKHVQGRLTIEVIEPAIQHLIDKGMRFKVFDDGMCWEARCGNRCDSGNTAIPLGVLVRACEFVTRTT